MQQNYVLAGIVALWFCTAYLGRITKCGLQPDILSLEARACHTTGCKHMEIRDTIECQVHHDRRPNKCNYEMMCRNRICSRTSFSLLWGFNSAIHACEQGGAWARDPNDSHSSHRVQPVKILLCWGCGFRASQKNGWYDSPTWSHWSAAKLRCPSSWNFGMTKPGCWGLNATISACSQAQYQLISVQVGLEIQDFVSWWKCDRTLEGQRWAAAVHLLADMPAKKAESQMQHCEWIGKLIDKAKRG